jgi:hypothetical protein
MKSQSAVCAFVTLEKKIIVGLIYFFLLLWQWVNLCSSLLGVWVLLVVLFIVKNTSLLCMWSNVTQLKTDEFVALKMLIALDILKIKIY